MQEYFKKLMEQEVAAVQSTPGGEKLLVGTKSTGGAETQRIPKGQNPGLAGIEIVFPMDAASCFPKGGPKGSPVALSCLQEGLIYGATREMLTGSPCS